jgi:TolC family type I secretion outer membrane protein
MANEMVSRLAQTTPKSARFGPLTVVQGLARLAVVTALASTLMTGAATAESLIDALASAYSTNPTLLAQRAALRVLDESVSNAVAGWRPTVSVSASAGQKRTNTSVTPGRTFQPQSLSFSLSQNLYRGGRTVAGVRKAEFNVLAGRETLRNVEQTVLLSTVRAYLNVLRDRALVQLNEGNVSVLGRQLDATRDQFEVGEITRTNVSQAEARLSRAISDLIQAEGNLESSQSAYEALVGHSPDALERVPFIENMPATLDQAISVALERNPSLRAATNSERASAFDVAQKRGSILPTLKISGDLSHSEEASSATSESDSASITATLSIPLYQSGSEYSDVRKSLQTNNQKRIQVEESRRSVIEDVTQAWERLSTASARIRSRADEVAAAEIALEGVRQEAEVGSRTVLDVLNAEQELLDARVSLVSGERDEYVAAFELRSAIGRLSAEEMLLPVAVYNPLSYYRQSRNRLFGTTIDQSAGE